VWRRTFLIIHMVVLALLVISLVFPYQRFNIAIKYSTIIRIIMGAVLIAMAAAGYLLY